MNQDLSIVRGTTNAFTITVRKENGDLYELESGQAFVFAVKKRHEDLERVLIKKITHTLDDGSFYLDILPADTAKLEPGKYFYDVGLQHSPTVFYNIIESSVFEIKPNISEMGD